MPGPAWELPTQGRAVFCAVRFLPKRFDDRNRQAVFARDRFGSGSPKASSALLLPVPRGGRLFGQPCRPQPCGQHLADDVGKRPLARIGQKKRQYAPAKRDRKACARERHIPRGAEGVADRKAQRHSRCNNGQPARQDSRPYCPAVRRARPESRRIRECPQAPAACTKQRKKPPTLAQAECPPKTCRRRQD